MRGGRKNCFMGLWKHAPTDTCVNEYTHTHTKCVCKNEGNAAGVQAVKRTCKEMRMKTQFILISSTWIRLWGI